MVAKFLDLNYRSWQRLSLALTNDRRKLWASVLFLSAIRHRKVIHVNFFVFFLLYWQKKKSWYLEGTLTWLHPNVFTGQWQIQGRGPGSPPSLLLDQTVARRAEKNFILDRPIPLISGSGWPGPLLSEGLDPPMQVHYNGQVTFPWPCCLGHLGHQSSQPAHLHHFP